MDSESVENLAACSNNTIQAGNNNDAESLQAVVTLLRRHSPDCKLCCGDDETNLEVSRRGAYDFVTQVKCKECVRNGRKGVMETTCHDGGWAYKRIYNVSDLKFGDHICWHRPYVIWHHAIIIQGPPEIRVVHYNGLAIEQTALPPSCCNSMSGECDALYRVNYQDCYTAEYTVERANKLLNEKRYDLLERNCEHFARWCKTGLTSSSQVSVAWTSLGKIVLMVLLRAAALIILGMFEYSFEKQDMSFCNITRKTSSSKRIRCQEFENIEKRLIIMYMVVITFVFTLYLLVKACSELKPTRDKIYDVEVAGGERQHQDNDSCFRGCCHCILGTCWTLLRQAFYFCFCKCIECNPCTCCRRPCNLACGTFIRIFIREALAATGTFLIVWFGEDISDTFGIESVASETSTLMLCAAGGHITGYVVGSFLGRWLAACFQWCGKECSQEEPLNA